MPQQRVAAVHRSRSDRQNSFGNVARVCAATERGAQTLDNQAPIRRFFMSKAIVVLVVWVLGFQAPNRALFYVERYSVRAALTLGFLSAYIRRFFTSDGYGLRAVRQTLDEQAPARALFGV